MVTLHEQQVHHALKAIRDLYLIDITIPQLAISKAMRLLTNKKYLNILINNNLWQLKNICLSDLRYTTNMKTTVTC